MNFFVSMCVIAIKTGRMTIEQVPERCREEVEETLNADEQSD